MASLEGLPVELLADILKELDLVSLITVSGLSRRLRSVASDPSLNPWRWPVLRSLKADTPDPHLLHLGARNIVPRQTWLEVLPVAVPEWIVYQATLPNLADAEWAECFARRFPPSWKKWKKDGRWRPAFLSFVPSRIPLRFVVAFSLHATLCALHMFRLLSLVIHRRKTRCTADEAWTSYIVLNKNGSANHLEATSRNFSPTALFDEIKMQNDLFHLETQVRVVVQLADMRILALGAQQKPRMSFQCYPVPSASFANYPNYTPGGYDRRWTAIAGVEDGGRVWVGGFMLVAQLVSPALSDVGEDNLELLIGPGHMQYGSFTWTDLFAIAPWMEERIWRKIEGPGLGLD